MFEEQYEKLGMTDRENFTRIVNQLLAHTFLAVETYDPAEGITRVNRDYLFTERNLDMFRTYFSFAGFSLERDSHYGVIYLTSSYEGNRVRFDKLTTILVYALRLIYEEERAKLTLTKEVIITTGDLVHKLLTLGAIKKKPANAQLHASLRMLAHYRILEKLDGAWEAAPTRLLILPTILFIVTNEQISNLNRLLESEDAVAAETGDEQEEGYEEAE